MCHEAASQSGRVIRGREPIRSSTPRRQIKTNHPHFKTRSLPARVIIPSPFSEGSNPEAISIFNECSGRPYTCASLADTLQINVALTRACRSRNWTFYEYKVPYIFVKNLPVWMRKRKKHKNLTTASYNFVFRSGGKRDEQDLQMKQKSNASEELQLRREAYELFQFTPPKRLL